MQFQARSRGADASAMAVVQRHLLYEAPTRWMRERRPPSTYPPSFAHVANGYFATAMGRYLGKEVNGGREGNHLTHGIFTRDPASYGLVRPAQLYGAPFWMSHPSATHECATVDSVVPGPLNASRLQAFVTRQPDGIPMLAALLAAIERCVGEDGPRVLFIARDADAVLSWLCAATLLMPQRRAVHVGFRIFTTDPARSPQPVLAVHPDWDVTTVTVGNSGRYVVFDLVHGSWSDVPTSSTARRWVTEFCNEDPDDVVDAVEIAEASGLTDEVGIGIAISAVLRRPPRPVEIPHVVRWLSDAPQGVVESYGASVVDGILDSPENQTRVLLLSLDELAVAGRLRGRAARIRLALLDQELKALGTSRPETPVDLPRIPRAEWGPRDDAAAAERITAALAEAGPAQVDVLLFIAQAYCPGLVTVEQAAPAVVRLVDDWVEHPERAYGVRKGPYWPLIEGTLRAKLAGLIDRRSVGLERIGADWWSRLKPDTALATPLDEALAAACMRNRSPKERYTMLSGCLRHNGPEDRVDRFNHVIAVLYRDAGPNLDELLLICRDAPRGIRLPPSVFNAVLYGEYQASDDLLPQFQYVRDVLLQRGRLSADQEAMVHELDHQAALVRTILGALRGFDGGPADVEAMLVRLPRQTVDEYPGFVAQELAEEPRVNVVSMSLRRFPQLLRPLLKSLFGHLALEGSEHHVFVTYFIAVDDSLRDIVDPQLTAAELEEIHTRIESWVRVASWKKFNRATRMINARGPDWADYWERARRRSGTKVPKRPWRR
jgi:hypothetical protein